MQLDLDLDLGTYSPETGLVLTWRPDYVLRVSGDTDELLISGDREGLRTLAQHLLTLAQDHVPTGVHIHLDPEVGLEDDSVSMVVEKIAG